MSENTIFQINRDDIVVNEYRTSEEAQEATGIPARCIRSCAQRYRPWVGEFRYEYAPDGWIFCRVSIRGQHVSNISQFEWSCKCISECLNYYEGLKPEFEIIVTSDSEFKIKPTFSSDFQLTGNMFAYGGNIRWEGPRNLYTMKKISNNLSLAKLMQIKHIAGTAARRIQKAFRLWIWRKTVVWNPHTDIGKLNLMIRFNVGLREG